jgi:hypothetical protein
MLKETHRFFYEQIKKILGEIRKIYAAIFAKPNIFFPASKAQYTYSIFISTTLRSRK